MVMKGCAKEVYDVGMRRKTIKKVNFMLGLLTRVRISAGKTFDGIANVFLRRGYWSGGMDEGVAAFCKDGPETELYGGDCENSISVGGK